jgi:hypothetical protein
MQVYRVYVVNLNGHSADSPQILERADNDAAISHARQCLDGKPIESLGRPRTRSKTGAGSVR